MNSVIPPTYATLTPDCVLNALESVGFRSDGRLLALNSYENRVYQIGLEEGAPLVAKFYRPARWTDAAILEEHAYTQELVEREIPVVPALSLMGKHCIASRDFDFLFFQNTVDGHPNWKIEIRWNGWGDFSDAYMPSECLSHFNTAPR